MKNGNNTRSGKAARAKRQEIAVFRGVERSLRTPEQQIAVLDERLGKDVGAIKERIRLGQS